jgi:hypothetical protein
MEAIPEQEILMPHEVVMAEAEPEIPQLRLYRALMRDYEENPLRLEDDFDDLTTTQMEAASMWMSRIPRMGVMIGIESLHLSHKIRSEIKFS